ncbi:MULTISPECIES: hypothetical protein [unclassified Pseudomonas]|uniref:hypothetical protein n=1 Tax=unclassified Pseudomonas TaxID=196821 RepID=UPI001B318E42|nr:MULTISPECIES: hypothetical protein [unclassified Pseudomonas]MBP5948545.1 hypothetical protein [Pseudomonas sp. P9(2020)]MBZ9560727.1 hypothetical protein [Pseudomonas sp. P116]
MSAYAIPDGAKFATIKFARRDGNVYTLPPGSPVIVAALRHDPDHGAGARELTGFKPVYALLDTGADFNFATPELIAEAGCPQIDTARLRSASGWIDSTKHLAHIFLPETGSQYETDVFSSPLIDEGGIGQSLIIGILVIKSGRLVMDYKSNIFRFYVS